MAYCYYLRHVTHKCGPIFMFCYIPQLVGPPPQPSVLFQSRFPESVNAYAHGCVCAMNHSTGGDC